MTKILQAVHAQGEKKNLFGLRGKKKSCKTLKKDEMDRTPIVDEA